MTALALDTTADDALLVRRVLSCWTAACTDERATAANALARAYLYTEMTPEARAEGEIALTRALDDPEPRVRRALAEALARAHAAPRHLILALAADTAQVSRIVLGASPLLTDPDLVEAAATSEPPAQVAIARRAQLSAPVSAALAEVGDRTAALALAGNHGAKIGELALWRLIERFGEDAQMRARLAERPGLTAALRAALADAEMTACARETERYEPRHASRIARDGREQAFVAIAVDCEGKELAGLVKWLRESGHMTIGLLARSLAGAHLGLLAECLAQMAGAPHKRAQALMRSPRGQGFAALWRRAAMPAPLLPAFRVAIENAQRYHAGVGVNATLTARMAREIEALQNPALEPVTAKLWRLAAEATRADAREFDPAALEYRNAETETLEYEAPPVELEAEPAPADTGSFEPVAVLNFLAAELRSFVDEAPQGELDAEAAPVESDAETPEGEPIDVLEFLALELKTLEEDATLAQLVADATPPAPLPGPRMAA